jgi:Protein of unknown function (DUF2726)
MPGRHLNGSTPLQQPPQLLPDGKEYIVDPILAFLVILLVGSFVMGMTFERWTFKRRIRREKLGRGKSQWSIDKSVPTADLWGGAPQSLSVKPIDAADQLRKVLDSSFSIQPLLNKSEARVLKELERIVIDCNPAWQVMAQVSLGEVLRSKDAEAYSCINSKRVDLLLVDGDCMPRLAIEYQGGSHHQGHAAARDAVKKEALRRAGVGYLEVVAGQTTPSQLRLLVEKLIDQPEAPASIQQLVPKESHHEEDESDGQVADQPRQND